VLRDKGWHAVGLATLEEARERLMSATAADVVVVDLSLAGADAALLRELRGRTPAPRLIAVTGSPPEHAVEALFDVYLVKPALPDRLIEVIDRLLGPLSRVAPFEMLTAARYPLKRLSLPLPLVPMAQTLVRLPFKRAGAHGLLRSVQLGSAVYSQAAD
jgi:DNA-binding response OmpR family regulator